MPLLSRQLCPQDGSFNFLYPSCAELTCHSWALSCSCWTLHAYLGTGSGLTWCKVRSPNSNERFSLPTMTTLCDLPTEILDAICLSVTKKSPGTALIPLQLTNKLLHRVARRRHLHTIALKSPEQIKAFDSFLSNLTANVHSFPNDVLPPCHLFILGTYSRPQPGRRTKSGPPFQNEKTIHRILSLVSPHLHSLFLEHIIVTGTRNKIKNVPLFPELRELVLLASSGTNIAEIDFPAWPRLQRLYTDLNSRKALEGLTRRCLSHVRINLRHYELEVNSPVMEPLDMSRWEEVILDIQVGAEQPDREEVLSRCESWANSKAQIVTIEPPRAGRTNRPPNWQYLAAWTDRMQGGNGCWSRTWSPQSEMKARTAA